MSQNKKSQQTGGKEEDTSRDQRKERVLTQGEPSVTQSIADAVVLKDGDPFFLTDRNGNVPLTDGHGFGLYYHDCRFLDGYEFKMAGGTPSRLVSTAARGYTAVFELTNPRITAPNENTIKQETVGITWRRTLDGEHLMLHDILDFHNFNQEEVSFAVSLSFRARFQDVFYVRDLLRDHPGDLKPPQWEDGALSFVYEGAGGLWRSANIYFSPQPDSHDETTAHFDITLGPREHKQIVISIALTESEDQQAVQISPDVQPEPQRVEGLLKRAESGWMSDFTNFVSDSLLLNRIIDRSLRDLRMLRTTIQDEEFFAAGLPWFGTLFGRDAVITALQTIAFNPEVAEQTLRVLSHYQGDEVDEWRDEQPGKLLHELRIGELARTGRIPHTPYYGTVDTTPLFLMLMAEHAKWTGDMSLFDELREHVERGLEWIDKWGDHNGDGYVEYESHSEKGLVNQGWKDSGTAIVEADGTMAEPPISLVEVQGYVYRAKLDIADLYERAGDTDRADELRQQARQLYEQFNRDFWSEEMGIYVLALEKGNEPCAVVSSNPGHALWTGIAEPEKARRSAERLMQPDMFNGWGVRTLSAEERSYNPVGYHLGTVWPHDNSIILAGMRRYNHDDFAHRIFHGITQAAMNFDMNRLPELFAGYPRKTYQVPVNYPVACHPQAWAAGSVPFMLVNMLGLQPDAFNKRLHVQRPILPDFADRMDLLGLRVGEASVDLHFERTSDAHAAMEVMNVEGELDVIMDSEQEDGEGGGSG